MQGGRPIAEHPVDPRPVYADRRRRDAVERAAAFSEEAFATRWREIAAGLGLG